MLDMRPSLIEPGMKYITSETLKQCHKIREKYNYVFYNIGFLIIFFILLAAILLYKYKGKLTPYEKNMKKRKEYQYILSQIKNIKVAKQRTDDGLLTQLPLWE